MSNNLNNIANDYNEKYRRDVYFRYKTWLYKPYIRAIVRKAKLRPGDRVLDAGCGQGFFSSLFDAMGFTTLGIDISSEGIRSAIANYSSTNTTFRVGDLRSLDLRNEFDCVFARSCSVYNTEEFEISPEITAILLRLVKIGGVLIFDY